MEEPSVVAKTIKNWILEFVLFVPTWLQVVTRPTAFLRRSTGKRSARKSLTQPIIFWTLNALGAIVFFSPGDGVVSWTPQLTRAAAGTAVLALILARILRMQKLEDKWRMVEVAAYSSAFYIPIAGVLHLLGERALRCFYTFLAGKDVALGTQLILWVYLGTLFAAIVGWSLVLAKGMRCLTDRWRRLRSYAFRVWGAVFIVLVIDVIFAVVPLYLNWVRFNNATDSLVRIGKNPSIEDAPAYSDASVYFRNVAAHEGFRTGHRYRAQQLASVASIAFQEAMSARFAAGKACTRRSTATALLSARQQPVRFENLLESWASGSNAFEDPGDMLGVAELITRDLSRLRYLRSCPDFELPAPKSVGFGVGAWGGGAVLELWPGLSSERVRSTIVVGEQTVWGSKTRYLLMEGSPFDASRE